MINMYGGDAEGDPGSLSVAPLNSTPWGRRGFLSTPPHGKHKTQHHQVAVGAYIYIRRLCSTIGFYLIQFNLSKSTGSKTTGVPRLNFRLSPSSLSPQPLSKRKPCTRGPWPLTGHWQLVRIPESRSSRGDFFFDVVFRRCERKTSSFSSYFLLLLLTFWPFWPSFLTVTDLSGWPVSFCILVCSLKLITVVLAGCPPRTRALGGEPP